MVFEIAVDNVKCITGNEKAAPEILQFEADLIERSREQIQLMKQQPCGTDDEGCCKEVRICNHPEGVTNQQIVARRADCIEVRICNHVTNQQIVVKKVDWVLLIATLLFGITCRVQFHFLGSSITSEDEEGHFQMSKKQDFRWFLLLNSTVFNASVGLVLFRLQRLPMKPLPQISVLAMFGAFVFCTLALLPNESPALLFMSFASGLFSAAAAKLCMIWFRKTNTTLEGGEGPSPL